jgi:flagellar biosynthesis anti-sigma factor FlgM
MNIDRVNIGSQGIDRSNGAQTDELTRSSGKDRRISSGSDSVELSSRANELSRIANVVEQSRADQVNRVRAELESGAYRVSAEDIAAKLIVLNRL